jgi:hypothetical protein
MSNITDVDPRALVLGAQELTGHAAAMDSQASMLDQATADAGNFWGNNPEDGIAQMMQAIFPATMKNLIAGSQASAANLKGLADGVSSTGDLFTQSSTVNNAAVDAAVGNSGGLVK